MACACPVVGFRTSGLMDIVDHKQNGYLADPFDPVDLANGISWVIEDTQRQKELSQEAQSKALREFELGAISKQYLDLYRDVLKNRNKQISNFNLGDK
jgi:glycosyltransferase involved in cell wall biosynthesis